MELKYKDNVQFKITGSIWLLVSLLYIGLLVFILTSNMGGFKLIMSPFLILLIVSSSVLAVFNFKIPTIDYVRVNEHTLSTFRSLVLKRKEIDLSEVEQGRIVGNKLILILHNEKEFEISLKNLTIKDSEKLIVKLKKSFLIS